VVLPRGKGLKKLLCICGQVGPEPTVKQSIPENGLNFKLKALLSLKDVHFLVYRGFSKSDAIKINCFGWSSAHNMHEKRIIIIPKVWTYSYLCP
jgi:hypothetical protein